jgi:hypothetical protein
VAKRKNDDYELDLFIGQKLFGYKGNIRCMGPVLTDAPKGFHTDKPVITADGDLVFLPKFCEALRAIYANT